MEKIQAIQEASKKLVEVTELLSGASINVYNNKVAIDTFSPELVLALPGELEHEKRNCSSYPYSIFKMVEDVKVFALLDHEKTKEILSQEICPTCGGVCNHG